jgi:crossover junction endodeoxyribonuclease RuvC
MIVLGLDPGLVCTGYGALEGVGRATRVIEAGVVRPNDALPLAERLHELHSAIEEILARLTPTTVVVEEIYSKYDHPRTAILMGHARGVILLAAARHGAPVVSYAASHVKKALTSSGRASKEQVQRMVVALLGLPAAPGPADVTDALALAACHLAVLTRDRLSRG